MLINSFQFHFDFQLHNLLMIFLLPDPPTREFFFAFTVRSEDDTNIKIVNKLNSKFVNFLFSLLSSVSPWILAFLYSTLFDGCGGRKIQIFYRLSMKFDYDGDLWERGCIRYEFWSHESSIDRKNAIRTLFLRTTQSHQKKCWFTFSLFFSPSKIFLLSFYHFFSSNLLQGTRWRLSDSIII